MQMEELGQRGHDDGGQGTSSSITPEALLDLACEAGSKGEFEKLEKHCATVLAIPHNAVRNQPVIFMQ